MTITYLYRDADVALATAGRVVPREQLADLSTAHGVITAAQAHAHVQGQHVQQVHDDALQAGYRKGLELGQHDAMAVVLRGLHDEHALISALNARLQSVLVNTLRSMVAGMASADWLQSRLCAALQQNLADTAVRVYVAPENVQAMAQHIQAWDAGAVQLRVVAQEDLGAMDLILEGQNGFIDGRIQTSIDAFEAVLHQFLTELAGE